MKPDDGAARSFRIDHAVLFGQFSDGLMVHLIGQVGADISNPSIRRICAGAGFDTASCVRLGDEEKRSIKVCYVIQINHGADHGVARNQVLVAPVNEILVPWPRLSAKRLFEVDFQLVQVDFVSQQLFSHADKHRPTDQFSKRVIV